MWSKHCPIQVHFGSLSCISSHPTCSQTGQKSNNFLFKSRQRWKHSVSWGWNTHNRKEKTFLSERQFDRSQAGDKRWPSYMGLLCTQLLHVWERPWQQLAMFTFPPPTFWPKRSFVTLPLKQELKHEINSPVRKQLHNLTLNGSIENFLWPWLWHIDPSLNGTVIHCLPRRKV